MSANNMSCYTAFYTLVGILSINHDVHGTNFSFQVFLQRMNLLDDLKFNASVDNLQLFHCNSVCNGSRRVQATFRQCDIVFPTCKPCNCDAYCVDYGDCCPDERGEITEVKVSNEFQCVSMVPANEYSAAYYMITSCPKNTPLENIEQGDLLPLTSSVTNVTYKNEMFAECNGAKDLIRWISEINCYNKTIYVNGTALVRDSCFSTILIPHGAIVRPCMPIFETALPIDACNATGKWDGLPAYLETRCRGAPSYPIVAYFEVYRNIFCLLCNGIELEPCRTIEVQQGYSINVPVKLFIKPSQRGCKPDEWFDSFKRSCRALHCPSGFVLEEKACAMSNTSLKTIEFSLEALFRISDNHVRDEVMNNWTFVQEMALAYFQNHLVLSNVTYSLFKVYLYKPIKNDDDTTDLNPPVFEFNLQFRVNQSCCRQGIDETLVTKVMKPIVINYAGFEFNATISDKYWFEYHRDDSTMYDLQTSGVLEKLEGRRLVDLINPEEYIYLLPDVPHTPYVFLRKEDTVVNEDGFLTLTYANVTISPDNYTVMNNGLFAVSVETLNELYRGLEHEVDVLERAGEILSITLSVISLSCLLITFVTNCSFPALLTVPMKNMTCLVLVLFVAQLLLQFNDLVLVDDVLCKIWGVTLHYFWLCVIFWMNVCSYHMFHVFVVTTTKPLVSSSPWKSTLRYALYANGIPFLIVVFTITGSIASGAGIGYGRTRCYLSTTLLTGISFVLPLAVILVANSIFFGVTVWTMSKISKMSATVGKESCHVHIYMKLSTLTGLFWVLSIIAETLDISILVLLSIIINASQGIFIFFSYTANKKVFQLWMTRLKGQDTSDTSITMTSTTKSTII